MSAKNIGPYKIEKRLGVGGMGEVFKAYDERLGRWVAIKRIRPDKEGAGDNRERLRREARAVAQLNHSAIVQVYDIFQDGQSDCIVMEYVEGQTLDVLLKEGPIDPLRAAVLGHEIAEGLAEAHSKKVIHRDLKTENIIVTPSGRAKILDFGLAKPISADGLDPVLTGKGQLVGTSRAMSPEYVGGGEVDARADLFSLGVLLYETVVGKSPFRAQNTLATLKQVILHRQTPASELNPSVPHELSELIDRLLEKEPDNRPDTAEVVATDLGRIAGQLSSGTIDLPSATLRGSGTGSRPSFASPSGTTSGSFSATATLEIPRPPNRVPLWILAAAILVTAMGGYLFWQRQQVKPPTEVEEPEPIWVVVGDFINQTDDPLYDKSLDTAFRSGLEQSNFVRVVPENRIDDAVRRMKLDEDTSLDEEQWIEITRREQAAHLTYGEIFKIGDGKRFTVVGKVIDPHTGVVQLSKNMVAGSSEEILDGLNQITDSIRSWLGESGSDIESTQRLEKVTTRNIDALDAYSRAITQEKEPTIAIPLLQKAIALDPEFAMAHAKLGAIYRNEDQESKAVFHFNKALENSDRLSDIEGYYVRGWKAYSDRDQEELIESWSLITTLYPDNPQGYLNLGSSYYFLQLYDRAAEAFRLAATIAQDQEEHQGFFNAASQFRAFALVALNRYEEAQASLQPLDPALALEPMFYVHLATDDHAAALALLEKARAGEDLSSTTLADEFLYFEVDQGSFSEALSRRGLPLPQTREMRALEHRLDWLLDRIALLEVTADQQNFNETASLILETVRATTETSEISAAVPNLAIIGKSLARRGRESEAAEIYDLIKAPAESSFDLWRSLTILLESEIYATKGDLDTAIDLAEQALRIAETFEAHETLGRLKVESGEIEAADFHYRRIHQMRGRAIVESTGSVTSRLIAWNIGIYELGKLREKQGDLVQADHFYEDFLSRWNHSGLSGEVLDLVKDARLKRSTLADKLAPAPPPTE